MDEILARGPNFVYGKEFIRREYGAGTWERVLSGLEGEAATVWGGTLLVNGSYPFAAFKHMLAVLAETVGVLPEKETARMYEYIADRSLSTIYKMFFRFADPSFVISRYPMLWKRFFLAGRVAVLESESGRATLEFLLPEIFLDWLPPACFGYSKKAVEMAGGRDLQMEETDRTRQRDGIWRIRYDLRWSQ